MSAVHNADDEMAFYNGNNVVADLTMIDWEERCFHIREGQIQLDLARRIPPLDDAGLKQFSDWLDVRKLPVVLADHKYLKKTGVSVDLSDNRVGPEGIDKLLLVLMKHEVPCTVLKAWRNVLDDSVVDALVQYLHIQPATMPLWGLHLSHNRISSKGAYRLIKALIECGHYPTRMSRKPFWLRLELNEVERPEDIVHTCKTLRNRLRPDVKYTLCLMQKGLCASVQCDHESVAVHAPYFLGQNKKGYFEERDRAMVEAQAFQTGYIDYNNISAYRQNLSRSGDVFISQGNARPAPSMQFLEVCLDDCCGSLGFSLGFSLSAAFPVVRRVDASGEAGLAGLKQNMILKRVNGVDVSMLMQSQVEEALKQRPLSLRFTLQ